MTGRRLLVTSGKLQSLSLITKSHPGPWQRERKGPARSSSMYAYLESQTLRDGNGCWLTSRLSLSVRFYCVFETWTQRRNSLSVKDIWLSILNLSGPQDSGEAIALMLGNPVLCLYHWERVLWGLEQMEAFSIVLAVPTAVAQGAATIFFTSCGFAGLESEKPIFILILFEPISLISLGLLFTPALGHKEGPVMSC